MADIHVLEQVQPGVFRVAMHIPIPAGNNPAAVPWRTIIARVAGTSVLPEGDGTAGTISATEKALIASGVLYELVTVEEGQTMASVPVVFTRRSAETLADLRLKYAQYGRTI